MAKFFEIDDIIVRMYAKYGHSFFDAEEVVVYYNSLDVKDKIKFLFLVAYELQEMDEGMETLLKFQEFSLAVDMSELSEDDARFYNALFCMAKALSKQCVIPKETKDLMEHASKQSDVKGYFELVVTNLLQCFEDMSECVEDDFGKNMILRCIYDYETDYIYNILRGYLSNFNNPTKSPLDHAIAFADYDPRLVGLFVSNLYNYYLKNASKADVYAPEKQVNLFDFS